MLGSEKPTKGAMVAIEMRDGAALADELLQRVSQMVGEKATVTTVFGDPVERDGITIVPVARARFGFGAGGGGGARGGEHGSGGGGGGGALVSPAGYIELRGGTAEFKRISSPIDLFAVIAAASIAVLALRRIFT
jgi:uncharacterized spore protein YtfJ